MDSICVKGMEFFGYHGVLPEETRLGQRFVVDLVLRLDLREAGEHDRLEASINYAEAYGMVKALVEGSPMKTLEALAEAIAAQLKKSYERLQEVQVTVHKPGAPVAGIFQDVSVTIER